MVEDEPDNSNTNSVTVSNPSKPLGEHGTLLTVKDNQDDLRVTVSNCSQTKRSRGLGTGRIQWRTFTSSSGKEYKQPWYDWQVNEGGKTKTRTKYIPKRLLTKVQALEAALSPVQDVLRVLGIGKRSGESPESISPNKEVEEFFRGNSQESCQSISPNKEVEDFIRGNSQESCQSISPNKKGRGKNQISASGSLVPVVQKKRDKEGRVVEYPRVEGERVPRELAFDYPHQFNWQYCYSVQDEDDCWQTKKLSVPPERVWSVRSAIAVDKPMSFILSLIRGRGFY
jgi:hypothetical protein